MSGYTIKYNRTTNHIDGLTVRTTGGGKDMGDHVSYYAENACGSLTRYRFAQGATYATLAEALEAARKGGRKLCKTCEKAVVAQLEAEATDEGGTATDDEMAEEVGDIQCWLDEKPSRGFCVIGKGKSCHITRGNDESLCGKLMMDGSRYIDPADTLDYTPCRTCWKIMERESAELEEVGNMAAKLKLSEVRGDIRIGSATGSDGVPHAIKETTGKGNVPYCSAKLKNPLRSWGPALEQNPSLELCAGCSKHVPTGPVNVSATNVEIPGLGRTISATVITPVDADTTEEKTEKDTMAAKATMTKAVQEEVSAQIRGSIERLPSLIAEGKGDSAKELSEEIGKEIPKITGTGAAAIKAKLRAELTKVEKDAKKAKADKEKAEKGAAKGGKKGAVVAISRETSTEAALADKDIKRLIAQGNEKVKELAENKFKGGHQIAEIILDIRTRISNKDGHPDLVADSDAARKSSADVYDRLLEGLPEEGEAEWADAIRAEIGSIKKSARNAMVDVRANYIRSLDNSPEEAEKYKYALEAHPDKKPSEAVAEFHGYELRTRAEIAKANREKKAIEKAKLEEAVKAGEMTEEEAEATLSADGKPEATPEQKATAEAKKLKRSAKALNADIVSTLDDKTKKALKEELEAVLESVKASITALL
ncbi:MULTISPECIES: hypothetical protein [Streptomyces]|uniref:hypothetical protein n=1 Tax=Streptomyces TaxID=1883 RepID=UPI000B9EA5B3|nr:hypothetical protein [Streptomyces kasugaensis]